MTEKIEIQTRYAEGSARFSGLSAVLGTDPSFGSHSRANIEQKTRGSLLTQTVCLQEK